MPDVQGAQGLAEFISAYQQAMPDIHFAIEDIVGEGDKVVWRITATGVHLGDFMGIPPAGGHVKTPAVIVSRFSGGKWAEDFVVYDALSMLQQMGAIPTPEASPQPAATH